MNGIHPDLLKQLREYYKPGTRIIETGIGSRPEG